MRRCTSTQTAAVECFVANAVQTKLAAPAHGMSLAQYEVYGVAVTRFMEDSSDLHAAAGTGASAIADAMPATNANGSANAAAQATAVNSMDASAVEQSSMLVVPAGTSELQMEDFSLDLVLFSAEIRECCSLRVRCCAWSIPTLSPRLRHHRELDHGGHRPDYDGERVW